MNKPELLCPAGDLERLQMALHFGADAVYLAGAQFGMRAGAENFTPDGIRERGSHAELMAKKGVYYGLYTRQYREEQIQASMENE